MLNAAVQLVRNALCCVKDLGWFRKTPLWNAELVREYVYDFPEPLNKTTPLEVLISITQLFACLSLILHGASMSISSWIQIQRLQRLMNVREMVRTDADRLVNAALIKQGVQTVRNLFLGWTLACLGASFFWLAANSWHITETDWIGGLPGLINALTVAELCLAPCLYFMYKDGMECLAKAEQMQALAEKMRLGNLANKDVGLFALDALAEKPWNPFWNDTSSWFGKIDSSLEEKCMADEKKNVQAMLDSIVPPPLPRSDDDAREKEAKMRMQTLTSQADELFQHARATRFEGYRELVYLIVNFIAFYGYALGIIVFYWQDESNHPFWIRQLILGMKNADADWHGNFAGDLMWTIEPAIILSSPLFLNRLRPKKSRPSDNKNGAIKQKAE